MSGRDSPSIGDVIRSEQLREALRRFEQDPRKPFWSFLDGTKEIEMSILVLEATLHTTSKLLGLEKAARAFAQVLNQDQKSAQQMVEAAKKQQELGFPLVYGQFAILTWSALEAYIHGVSSAWLGGPSSLWAGRHVVTARVDLDAYEKVRAQRQVGSFLFDLVKAETRPEKPGLSIDRWQAILARRTRLRMTITGVQISTESSPRATA